MQSMPFDRKKHLYKNEAFAELVKDAIRFFNGTPVHSLSTSERFLGTGVYALYYIGQNPLYARYAELNRLAYTYPIYVGKAVPKGWRQSRISDSVLNQSRELHSRLREHSRNIAIGARLSIEDFRCRFVIFENEGSDMIGTIEAALIKLSQPLWNSAMDGFGNHDPGRGRYEQAKSDWDVIHPGRPWAERCNGVHKSETIITATIERHLNNIGREASS
jgi:Eco29kI restriction endonuclease